VITQLAYLLFIGLGSGYAAWKLLKLEEEDGYARLFLYMATGLVIFVQASTVLGFLNLSNWYAYAALTVALLALSFKEGIPKIEMPKISKNWIIVTLLFLIHLYVYATGALSYPWLEDDDPWVHASAARYVSIYGTYIQPEHLPIHYLAPYPPFFDALLGVLFQVDGNSLQFTLKFFNALLISLTIPLFYCWAKRIMKEREALWATAILTALPSFMSHFIWSQTLAMVVAVLAFYFIEKIAKRENANWELWVAATLVIATVLITQASTAVMFMGLLVIYVIGSSAHSFVKTHRIDTSEIKKITIIIILGAVAALIEFWLPMFIIYGIDQTLEHNLIYLGHFTDKATDTSGGVVYGLMDYVNAPPISKMDQPTGWGLIITILLLGGIIVVALKIKENPFMLVLLLWLLYGLLGTEGNLFPIKLFPHRFWVILAIPVAILGGLGAANLLEYLESKKRFATVAMVFLSVGLVITSAAPKYEVESSAWPPGGSWIAEEHIAGYVKLKELPANTKVFSFCGNEDQANGMDMFGYSWVKEIAEYKNNSINESADKNYAFLKKYEYEYAVIDQSCLLSNPPEAIQSKLNALVSDGHFSLQEQLSGNAFIVFKIN